MIFYVTFGCKYAREPHPVLENAHPDGWVELHAESAVVARIKVKEIFGDTYSMLRLEEDWDPSFYPRGRLAVMGDE